MNKTLLYKWSTLVILTVGVFFCVQISIAAVPEGHDFTVVSADAIYKPGELLVRFAPKAGGEQRSAEEKNQILSYLGGAALKRSYKLVPGLSLVKLPPGQTVKDALKTFNNTDGILYAEPNYRIYFASTFPNDPDFSKQWGLHNTGQTGGKSDADIDAPEAWDIVTDSVFIVAVLDTGVDYTHPDLAYNMWINEAEYNGDTGVDDDNNGYIDDIRGWDFSDDYEADPMDYAGHGTQCAGIIGAVGNNNEGIAGVCWNVKIMPLALCTDDFLTEGCEWDAWVASAVEAIDYAVYNGARVLSNSWGEDDETDSSLEDTIAAARDEGVLFIAAAMNVRYFTPHPNNDTHPIYPASYDLDNIIAVLATDQDDYLWDDSHYGLTSVDLGAPGVNIRTCDDLNTDPDEYTYNSGTSMATPHVAGAAALIWAVNPYLSYQEVKDILLDTVDHLVRLEGKCVSEGRLNLYKALHRASLYPGPGGFCVESDSGEPVARFDNFGNLFLKGSKQEDWQEPDGQVDEFIIEKNSGPMVYIDDSGNLYLKGNFTQGTPPTATGADEFRVQNSEGEDVAIIKAADGSVHIKGKLYENPE